MLLTSEKVINQYRVITNTWRPLDVWADGFYVDKRGALVLYRRIGFRKQVLATYTADSWIACELISGDPSYGIITDSDLKKAAEELIANDRKAGFKWDEDPELRSTHE